MKEIEMFVAAISVDRNGWCVFLSIDDLTMTYHAGPFSEQAAAESEARRLNNLTENVGLCRACCDRCADAAEIAELRKDAERYRWHRQRNPSLLLTNAWGASKAACAIEADVDAATDAAMSDAPSVGIA